MAKRDGFYPAILSHEPKRWEGNRLGRFTAKVTLQHKASDLRCPLCSGKMTEYRNDASAQIARISKVDIHRHY